ncbi:TDT family transporter [Shewanella sp. NIFS-20-20]|uniref:TDT family transporter n=1 Tax=Shewanella sp. NIFS-20-20 TaxID=2853806 RepID=UPI001C44A6F5|nr:TDT family transporter [Shewanella sp. NIFS-20-20]MBV7314098.1 TDT family transporter [Shewanella sp. NIFS-20-20]
MSTNESVQYNNEIGPNWFASVMGTGIIANAAAGLPIFADKLTGFAILVWVIAALMLLVLLVVKVWQTLMRPHLIKRQLNDGVMAQFFGAPPMAMLTVAGGAVLVGHHVIPEVWAINLGWGLWIAGTITGLLTAIVIPYLHFTRYEMPDDAAFGGWLMPVVPPMVSATIGALLIPHATSLVVQQTLLYACYAMFGLSLVTSLVIITLIWSRLAHAGTSGGARVPTLWIVLGPLGQSVTAIGSLGGVALTILPAPFAASFHTMALLYGVPVWGFAFYWSIIAALLTLRAMRRKMPFALTWWAFTFPVGTCVTGTTQLAHYTELAIVAWGAVALFCGLLAAWLIAAIGTLKGLKHGHILKVPSSSPQVKSKKG